jgi:hypothetical protein
MILFTDMQFAGQALKRFCTSLTDADGKACMGVKNISKLS